MKNVYLKPNKEQEMPPKKPSQILYGFFGGRITYMAKIHFYFTTHTLDKGWQTKFN